LDQSLGLQRYGTCTSRPEATEIGIFVRCRAATHDEYALDRFCARIWVSIVGFDLRWPATLTIVIILTRRGLRGRRNYVRLRVECGQNLTVSPIIAVELLYRCQNELIFRCVC